MRTSGPLGGKAGGKGVCAGGCISHTFFSRALMIVEGRGRERRLKACAGRQRERERQGEENS